MTSPAVVKTSNAQQAEEIKAQLGATWIANIYRDRILKMRTRQYQLGTLTKNSSVEIQHTLLGVELKLGRRRLLCPDLATARYLAVFGRVGCSAVAIPYDITQISQIADDVESSWHHMLLMAKRVAANRSKAFGARLRRLLISNARDEILAAGAGAASPLFDQSTKQRRA